MHKIKIISVDKKNILKYGIYCVTNTKHDGYKLKLNWLKKWFDENLKIKLLFSEAEGTIGFIEYVPGKYSWRGIEASDYYVIHCIWIKDVKYRKKGYASLLLNNCIEDSKTEDKTGVAMVTSAGPWLAGKDLLLKNKFEIVDYYTPYYELLVKKNKEGPMPKFKRDREKILKEYTGLNIIFANQCPYIAKSVKELALIARSRGLPLKIIELESPVEAQNAPTPYGVFCIVYNGRLLADHYISNTRFKNILDKEI